MAALFRLLFLAPLAFLLACAAAAAIVVFALVRGFIPPPTGAEITLMMMPATIGAAAVAFFPALLAIVVAEAFGWRSLFYWLAVGGLISLTVIATPSLVSAVQAIGAFVVYLAWLPRGASLDSLPATDFVTTVLASGFAGGFVYWLLAGRWSGTKMDRGCAPAAGTTSSRRAP